MSASDRTTDPRTRYEPSADPASAAGWGDVSGNGAGNGFRSGPATGAGHGARSGARSAYGNGRNSGESARRRRRRWYTPWRASPRDSGRTARLVRPPGRLRAWLTGWLKPSGSHDGAGDYDDDGAYGAADGLHGATKGCDVWFDAETARIEEDAVELARMAAAANLPRLEVAYEDVAEEGALVARCRATFHGWAERVRTRVQDALQACVQDASARLRSFEHEIGALDGVITETRVTRTELREAEAEAAAGQAQLEVRPFLSRWMYVPLIGMLVLVDWIANVPVFTELLPKDPGADAAWRELAARSETMGLWGGVYRIWARAVHNIDASLLALGVIIFLVWLAHVFGESLRRLFSHSAAETPAAAPTIRGHRRQFYMPALLSLLGVLAVLSVLWLARDRLEATTAQRVAETDARIEAVEAELEAARTTSDLTEIGRLEQQVAGLRVLRAQRDERADYALVISRMNVPILWLNIVLALAAAVAAYLATRDAVRGGLISPRAAALRTRITELREEAVRRRAEMVRLDAAIGRDFARADYLLASRPLTGWEARAERLRAVVPRFRSENARVRGVDTANIAAFRRPPQLELVLPDDRGQLGTPPELERYRELHEALRARAAAVVARMNEGGAS
jgi:hypothetical protein